MPLVFFRTEGGAEPVRDWLRSLSAVDRRAIGEGLKTLEYAWPVGMPLCRPMEQGLFELRVSLPSQRIARVLVCVVGGELVALHAFLKKTTATPKTDLELARQRKKLYERTGMTKRRNPHRGSRLDELLEEEGLLEAATAKAVKKVLAWQFAEAMRRKGVSKATLARQMKTSRAQLDRLLDPENQSVTLRTLTRAAGTLGKRVHIELVDS